MVFKLTLLHFYSFPFLCAFPCSGGIYTKEWQREIDNDLRLHLIKKLYVLVCVHVCHSLSGTFLYTFILHCLVLNVLSYVPVLKLLLIEYNECRIVLVNDLFRERRE